VLENIFLEILAASKLIPVAGFTLARANVESPDTGSNKQTEISLNQISSLD
jgi:hypothetical protein